MRITSLHVASVSLAALIGFGCAAGDTQSADELNTNMPVTSSSGTTDPSASGVDTTGGVETAPTSPSDTNAVPPATSTGPAAPAGTDPEPTNSMPVAGPTASSTATDVPVGTGGMPPVDMNPGGAGGAFMDPGPPMGGAPPIDVGGSGGEPEPVDVPPACEGPYCPRTGAFKMLAYSKTAGFRHTDSINTGKQMLQQIATEQGFEVTFTETNEEITPEGLAQYEVVFFMNSTGDIFNNNEQQIYEDWMTTQNGAFAGVHSATDTENGWAFYSEVTGQYYDLHEACCAEANIQWDPAALNFIAVQGLPSPWRRSEEWYFFNRNAEWSTKAGFQILSRVTSSNNTRPVSYIREWGNFRAFYTSLGHQGSAFQDTNVKQHVAAGIMWAVRREAELQ